MKSFAIITNPEVRVFVFSLLLFNIVAGSAQAGATAEFNPKRVIKKPFPAIINPKTLIVTL